MTEVEALDLELVLSVAVGGIIGDVGVTIPRPGRTAVGECRMMTSASDLRMKMRNVR